MDEQLIIKYLKGEADAAETGEILAWLEESEENRQVYYTLKTLWHVPQVDYFGSPSSLAAAHSTLTQNIRRGAASHRRKIYQQMARYAAVLLPLFAAGLVLWRWQWPVVRRPALLTSSVAIADNSKPILLADGSRVWLNNNSSLSYPATFDGSLRTVTVRGEAYFDVAADPHRPFVVRTSSMDIQVLGTAFNVLDYPAEQATTAVLVRGKIAILPGKERNMSGQRADRTVLEPGQMARLDRHDGRLTVTSADTGACYAWRTGPIILTGVHLSDIARRLTELYRLEVDFVPSLSDSAVYDFTFSRNKSPEQVMEMLRFIAPIRYQLRGTKLWITPVK